MNERIDHAAEALRLIQDTKHQLSKDAVQQVVESLVHAQLAVAEQLRIGNLIKLGKQWEETGYDFADSVAPLLRPDIAAALGVSNE